MTVPAYDSATGLFVYDYDQANEVVFDDCYRRAFVGLDGAVFETSPAVPLAEVAGEIGDWSQAPANSWLGLLASFPLRSYTRWAALTVVDFERATSTFGIERPGPAASDARVLAYLGELAAEAGIVPAGPLAEFGRSAYPDQMRAELGFDHRAFAQVASAGVAGHHLTVARGRFDPEAIGRAVAEDPLWSDLLEAQQVAGVQVFGWGSDFGIDLERMSPVRPVGHHRRLAVTPDEILWARWSDGITDALDAIDGRDHSLADATPLRVLAELADEKLLYTGVLTASLAAFVPDLARQRSDQYLLQRPQAVLVGDGVDELGRFVLVAAVYPSETAAETQLETLSQRITEMSMLSPEGDLLVEIDGPRNYSVSQDGSVLYAQMWADDDNPLPPAERLIAFG